MLALLLTHQGAREKVRVIFRNFILQIVDLKTITQHCKHPFLLVCEFLIQKVQSSFSEGKTSQILSKNHYPQKITLISAAFYMLGLN